MKIYSFFSGDTTYFTTSSSLKKAQDIGRGVKRNYYDNCAYLNEQPCTDVNDDYFIPLELEKVSMSDFFRYTQIDNNICILDDKLEEILMIERSTKSKWTYFLTQ